MTISVQSAKNKGRTFQQWVRDKILSRFPTLEPDDVKSCAMGSGGEDVQLSPAARKLFPYNVECKARKSIAVYEWLDQASTHGKHQPILFIKADRRKPLVVMDAEYFFNTIGSADGNKLPIE